MATARLDLSAFASGATSFAGVSLSAASTNGATTGSATASVTATAGSSTDSSPDPVDLGGLTDSGNLLDGAGSADDGDAGDGADPVSGDAADADEADAAEAGGADEAGTDGSDAEDANADDGGAETADAGEGAAAEEDETAASDPVVSTAVTTFVYADGGDGDGASVTNTTSGTAAGEDATSASVVHSYAIGSDDGDFAFGLGGSAASGEAYQDAEAAVEPEGDVVLVRDFELPENEDLAAALSLGIAWDYV